MQSLPQAPREIRERGILKTTELRLYRDCHAPVEPGWSCAAGVVFGLTMCSRDDTRFPVAGGKLDISTGSLGGITWPGCCAAWVASFTGMPFSLSLDEDGLAAGGVCAAVPGGNTGVWYPVANAGRVEIGAWYDAGATPPPGELPTPTNPGNEPAGGAVAPNGGALARLFLGTARAGATDITLASAPTAVAPVGWLAAD